MLQTAQALAYASSSAPSAHFLLAFTSDLLAHMATVPFPAPTSGQTADLRGSSSYTTVSLTSLLSTPPSRLPSVLRSIATQIRSELHLNPPQLADAKSPSLASVFPRFSNADVNFWIWVFGFRYRTVVRNWERCLGTPMERRFNWSGLALGAFYSAVRRALIVALALRALGALGIAGTAAWLAGRKVRRTLRGEPGWGLANVLGE